MFYLADRLREKHFGNRVDACSIINAKSGNCSEDCVFCAQSVHHNTSVPTYPLLPAEEILRAAQKAFEHGVRRFCIVTSGRGIDSNAELSTIAGCIEKIRKMGIMPCATLGTLDREQLKTLRDAGLHRYHHNMETAKAYFVKVCTTHDYEERVETLNTAKELGLSLCSGGIIGMGETMGHRAEMAMALREIGVDSVPLNFLMPVPGTPLEDADFITPLKALKTIALFRSILPDKEIRVCGGRLKALRDLHPMIFQAGANGLLMGDYLTTRGRDYDMDLAMLSDLGLTIAYENPPLPFSFPSPPVGEGSGVGVLYSIRMRASKCGLHISGAERIVNGSDVLKTTNEFLKRARDHERGAPDSITVTVDSLAGFKPLNLNTLPITDIKSNGSNEGRERAVSELVKAGVSEQAARSALYAMTSGASPSGRNMRGAMIVDAVTGERLEPDRERGIRARAVDYDEAFQPALKRKLKQRGLDNTHLKEALALATKVAHAPGAVAELCISDDPSYTTGYVASPGLGYVRITPMKLEGDPMGGRAFFVDGKTFNMDEYIRFLRETPVLVSGEIVIV